MGPGAFEAKHLAIDLVDEEPVGLYLCVSKGRPFAFQGMISAARRNGFSADEQARQSLEFFYFLAAILGAPDVSFELTRLDRLAH